MWKVASYLLIAAGVIFITGSRVDGEDMEYRYLTPEDDYEPI